MEWSGPPNAFSLFFVVEYLLKVYVNGITGDQWNKVRQFFALIIGIHAESYKKSNPNTYPKKKTIFFFRTNNPSTSLHRRYYSCCTSFISLKIFFLDLYFSHSCSMSMSLLFRYSPRYQSASIMLSVMFPRE